MEGFKNCSKNAPQFIRHFTNDRGISMTCLEQQALTEIVLMGYFASAILPLLC